MYVEETFSCFPRQKLVRLNTVLLIRHQQCLCLIILCRLSQQNQMSGAYFKVANCQHFRKLFQHSQSILDAFFLKPIDNQTFFGNTVILRNKEIESCILQPIFSTYIFCISLQFGCQNKVGKIQFFIRCGGQGNECLDQLKMTIPPPPPYVPMNSTPKVCASFYLRPDPRLPPCPNFMV